MKKENILEIIKQKNIEILQLQFINVLGQLHAVEIPVSQFDSIFKGEIMIDGSSIKGYSTITSSDLFLEPDWNTLLVLNFEAESPFKVARVLCFIKQKDGNPFPGDSRALLHSHEQTWDKKGFQLAAAFEPEFFLVKNENNNIIPADSGRYFDVSPQDSTLIIKRTIVKALLEHGFDIEAYHKEVAAGQHEINFKYDSALKTADRLITFKWIVRTIANSFGLVATFMPKPFKNVNGSGLHTNISVSKDNKNLFSRKSGEKLKKAHKQFISGLILRAKEIALVTNPIVNSYKRLIPGFEAPNCIAWSDSNRSAMIRVPASFGSSTRIEQRNVDPASNPYLVLSLIFQAGLEGIVEDIKLIPPVYENLFKLTIDELKDKQIELLPESLGESLSITSNSSFTKKVLGDHIFNEFIKLKTKEWKEYLQEIHAWEIQKYLEY